MRLLLGVGRCCSLQRNNDLAAQPGWLEDQLALPPTSAAMLPSISLEPKPRRSGSTTAGPPCSIHSIRSVDRRSASPAAVCQRISMRPPGTDSAPYLAALVVSSWNAIDSVSTARGRNTTSSPRSTMRSGAAPA
ncbi:MAG: hypothetical protein WDN48_07370 [Pseudolabrys sp.]